MAAQKQRYPENNNYHFILRPGLPPLVPCRSKIDIFYCFILSPSKRREAINRALKILPVTCVLLLQGLGFLL